MKTLQFRCRLLSDVILNVKSATEGNQSTLDFIPGNNFLGIVASSYDTHDEQQQLDLFHNGTVRYGDAHPVNPRSAVRSLRIPASMFYPKMQSISEKCYIHHAYDRKQDHNGDNGRPQQLKQSREGFYEFDAGKGTAVVTAKSFAIKSAYDRDRRRAQDSQMYGYESLRKGVEFLFEVETDKEEYAQLIIDALEGMRHIGRSRTAQYGLVEISHNIEDKFSQPASSDKLFEKDGKRYAVVYADSRLIFLDDNGEPTFQPEAKALGLEGTIRYDLSQVRTFQYAPWNYKRQTHDPDRCGIEKGSVLVVELPEGFTMGTVQSRYVGSFNNEGFGHVIYNPWFLGADLDKNGESLTQMIKPQVKDKDKDKDEDKDEDDRPTVPLAGTPLLNYLNSRLIEAETVSIIYSEVNDFVEANQRKFIGAQFASQWGAIRSLAINAKDYQDLKLKIFSNVVDVPRNPSANDPRDTKRIDKAYLGHGVATTERWEKQGRKQAFKAFVDRIYNGYHENYGDITIQAVVNLASEMAKICSKR